MKRLSTIVAQLWTPQTSVQEKDISVCILGAHGVGKTTFLYKLYFKYCTQQTDTPFEVLPTESHNVEVIPYCGRSYELWEFAGEVKQR
ncbi:hypothetical protein BDF14DRAFT_40006 [Spinellus fusiger]|nr:hypothetical protein BDF14DRAFT_40006 [Spinellus fusiger]